MSEEARVSASDVLQKIAAVNEAYDDVTRQCERQLELMYRLDELCQQYEKRLESLRQFENYLLHYPSTANVPPELRRKRFNSVP